jgi:hypothetical protein
VFPPQSIFECGQKGYGHVWEDRMTRGVQNSDDGRADELLTSSSHPVWKEYAEIEAWKVSRKKYDHIPSCSVCIFLCQLQVYFCFTDEENNHVPMSRNFKVIGFLTPQCLKRSGTSAKTDSREDDPLIEVHAVSCDVTASVSARRFIGKGLQTHKRNQHAQVPNSAFACFHSGK